MIALDTSVVQPWHLYALLGVFVSAYLLIGSLREQPRSKPVPFIGVALAVVVSLAAFWILDDSRLAYGLGIAAIVAIIAGRADEIGSVSVAGQLMWQLVIAGVLVLCGWTIPYVTNPMSGGVIDLAWQHIGPFLIPGSILAFLWILFFMNAINWIDGVDGLAASVLSVAFIALIVVSLLPQTQDNETLALSLVGLGAVAAFFIWNYPPAKVYLGTTGAWFLGMYAALVAMHGGGKIVTTALVLALPTVDVLFVIVRRIVAGQRPWRGDQVSHIHHRLLSAGLSPRSILILALLFSGALAVASIVASTLIKIILLAVIGGGFFLASLHVILKARISHNKAQ